MNKCEKIAKQLNLKYVRVTGGVTYEYLKNIDLFGRVTEEEEFYVFGCRDKDQPKFYQGIYEMDKAEGVFGLKSIEEVREFWESGCDGLFLYIAKGCYKALKGLR